MSLRSNSFDRTCLIWCDFPVLIEVNWRLTSDVRRSDNGSGIFSESCRANHEIFTNDVSGVLLIRHSFSQVCKGKGIAFEEYLEKLKHNGQWHVEVY